MFGDLLKYKYLYNIQIMVPSRHSDSSSSANPSNYHHQEEQTFRSAQEQLSSIILYNDIPQNLLSFGSEIEYNQPAPKKLLTLQNYNTMNNNTGNIYHLTVTCVDSKLESQLNDKKYQSMLLDAQIDQLEADKQQIRQDTLKFIKKIQGITQATQNIKTQKDQQLSKINTSKTDENIIYFIDSINNNYYKVQQLQDFKQIAANAKKQLIEQIDKLKKSQQNLTAELESMHQKCSQLQEQILNINLGIDEETNKKKYKAYQMRIKNQQHSIQQLQNSINKLQIRMQ